MIEFLRKNSFILTVLALSLLCFALSEAAKAETKGLPYNKSFPTAQFPYASVTAKCGVWQKPERLADEWGPVSFSGACHEQDRCYHTLGVAWGECNQRFLSDLKLACDRDLERANLDRGDHGSKPANGDAQRMCYQISDLYFSRVQTKDAASQYESEQREQKAYFKWVRTIIDATYKSVVKRRATAKEALSAMQSLAADYSLDDLKASLMGASMDQQAAVLDSSTDSISENSELPVADGPIAGSAKPVTLQPNSAAEGR